MNILNKLLKITSAVTFSVICLTSKADPKVMTLEELKVFLDAECEKTQKNLEIVRKNIKSGNAKGFEPIKGDEENLVPGEFSEKFKGITRVEYNEEGEPTVIETVNSPGSEILEALHIIPDEHPPFRQYMSEKFSDRTPTACLNRISKVLTTEELDARDITKTEKELLGGASVREITFDSILGSDVFDDAHRKKGKLWFSNPEELNQAVDDYASKAPLLKFITYCQKDTHVDLIPKMSQDNSTFEICGETQRQNRSENDFMYKVSGKRRETIARILANNLKNLLRHKNGKEKVILLLLLDEITPSGFKLQWVHDGIMRVNIIRMKIRYGLISKPTNIKPWHTKSGIIYRHISGCFRICEPLHQIKFAEELLLLKPTKPKTNEKIYIPDRISCSISRFWDNPHLSGPEISFDQLSERDLFICWQLVSRWDNSREAPNILGVYFSRSQNTIYVFALSDIRETKQIRYGHDPRDMQYQFLKNSNGEYFQEFETPEAQTVFENIVAETAEQKPSMNLLKLLCKLHKRSVCDGKEVLNMFDYDRKSFLEQHGLSELTDLKTVDE